MRSHRRAPLVTPSAPPRHAQLRAFLAVATERSFTRAAKRLGVSQPAISMQVRALEDTYRVELLARDNRGVTLTALGEELLETAQKIFLLEEEASELLSAAGTLLLGRLRVGADAPFLILPLLAAFRERHPQMELGLSLGNSSEVLRDILDGRTDIAALSDRIDDDRLFALDTEKSRQVVLVGRDHPWAKKKGLRFAELDGAPMVMREDGSATRLAFEKAARRAKIEPRVVMEIGSREALQAAVAAGLGIAAIIEAERSHDDRIVALPLLDVAIEHVEYVVCLQERRRLRAIEGFLDVVRARKLRRES